MEFNRDLANLPDISYRQRLEGESGLTWEEKYLLQIGMYIGRDRWEQALQLIERGSAAGRFEYPALRGLLAEVMRALGPYGMNKLRHFLIHKLGSQPEWDPDQQSLLDESEQGGAMDEAKAAGSKLLGQRSLWMFRSGIALGLGLGTQAAQNLLSAGFMEDQLQQVCSIVAYQFGFPFGFELSRHFD